MKQGLFGKFITSSLIVLLMLTVTGLSGLLNASALADSIEGTTTTTKGASAAIFVSKNAPVMFSLLENPERLKVLQDKGELANLKTSLLANTGVDYKKDIEPWLGKEITLAVTDIDIDRDPSNGKQPGYLIALATEKPEKSEEFLQLLFSQRVINGANLTVEEYEGLKVVSDTSQPEKGILAGAVVGNKFLLFANNTQVIKEAINNVQAPDLNLSSLSKYQQAVEQLPQDSIAAAFLNLPLLAEWKGLQLQEAIFDSEIIALTLPNKGLLAETSFLSSQEILPSETQREKPVGALQYIPSNTSIAISGTNLNKLSQTNLSQLWTQIQGILSTPSKPFIPKSIKPLLAFEEQWGLNLPSDIFSWVTGEYAIGLQPKGKDTTPDWIFVAEKLDTTPSGISHLDEIAASKGIGVTTLTLENQPISSWTELKTVSKNVDNQTKKSLSIDVNIQGVHATLGNYEVFTNNLETMDEVLKAKENTLTNNPHFRSSVAAIPTPNQGYLYLDWQKSQEILEQQLPILKLAKVIAKPIFENLQSLTLSSYGDSTGLVKTGIFFQTNK